MSGGRGSFARVKPLSTLSLSLFVALAACSAKEAPTPREPAPPGSAHAVASASAAPAASHAPPKPAEEAWDDPHESSEPIVMPPLVPKGTPKTKFPKVATTDRACWQDVPLTGQHEKDWATLIEKCGAPTGMMEYVAPRKGRMHHKHDKRDTYIMKVSKDQCYRIFAVADGSMEDMDIMVTRPNGALLADDKTKSPAAIIHNDHPWCPDDDDELHFHVEVDGPGHGHYTFGAWVRPKK